MGNGFSRKTGEMKKPVVFLDRDGTINEDAGYLAEPSGLVLIPGSAAAVRRLNEAGVMVVVVSNQSGVGRGYYTDSDVEAVNRRLVLLLGEAGASVDALYWCSHHPDDGCECRKPGTGLVARAVRELQIDAAGSYVVGDKVSDLQLAYNINAKGILVLTGKGAKEAEKLSTPAAFVARDLSEAVDWIIDEMKRA
ncbi:MAG: D-glycero-beta-D-manno-heptose 1,7-bisphosphate 7-phosphatase [Deltaproteobacteria bacterium]